MDVLDRFKNPFIEHRWQSVATQGSLKMKNCNVPLLLQHYAIKAQVPQYMSLGFGAYLLFMKSVVNEAGEYVGGYSTSSYTINDDIADCFSKAWEETNIEKFGQNILQDTKLWATDLSLLNGFKEAVAHNIKFIQSNGMMAALDRTEYLHITSNRLVE